MADQLNMFPAERRQERVDPEEIRDQMIALLDRARAARDTAPWDTRRQRYWRKVYPQMSNHLIDRAEADQLCFAFAAELDRIETLLAA
ncbi:hypothetical protein ACFCW2_06755 [Qipengyuania sp. DSG2-2]|uniref:hypothetical protein n=1 Tax=Qipengyuania sp. DGS2-2 TaxID=3349631 RepID=UPI0036D32CA4